jgi:hypothetical protein
MEKITEWCIVSTGLCAKSEVWAAWVQGVGSVLAIFAAVAIAAYQQYVQQALRAQEARERQRRVGQAALAFAVRLRHTLQLLTRASAFHNAQQMELYGIVLTDVSEWPRDIRAEELSVRALEALTTFHMVAIEARGQVQAMAQTYGSYEHWKSEWKRLYDLAGLALSDLARELGVPEPEQSDDPFVGDC